MELEVTKQTVREFIDGVADQHHAMAGAVISTTAVQAAMLLLDSNLRLWPEPALLEEFEPVRAELEREIRALRPVARIRQ